MLSAMAVEKHFAKSVGSLFKRGERFGVAVSGGVDSAVLLHLAAEFAGEKGLCPVVLHLNHGLRGREAEKDSRFVRRLARKYGLPLHSGKINVASLGRMEKISVEEAGREARLRFFREAGKKFKFKKVLLAHHRDDLAETVLMRLFRGTGIRGFRSMETVSTRGGLALIRPLLAVSKDELRRCGSRHHLRFREDRTNREERYYRNRIRQRVIPYLKKTLGDTVCDRLLSFRESLGLAQDFIARTAGHSFKRVWIRQGKGYAAGVRKFHALHPVIQYETLARAYAALSGRTLERRDWHVLEKVLEGRAPKVNLRGNIFLERRGAQFLMFRGQ